MSDKVERVAPGRDDFRSADFSPQGRSKHPRSPNSIKPAWDFTRSCGLKSALRFRLWFCRALSLWVRGQLWIPHGPRGVTRPTDVTWR